MARSWPTGIPVMAISTTATKSSLLRRRGVPASTSPAISTATYNAPSGGPAASLGWSADPRQGLTNFNQQRAALPLGKVDRFKWQGPDGFREEGILVYPPDFSKDRKYPLVLMVHGGPTAASTTEFSGFAHLVAARGYVVFEPNYRGSDNLGNADQRAIYNDANDGPGRDVMAGIAPVKKR